MAENKRNALILASAFPIFRGVFGKLLVKDNRRPMLAFADIAI
jgi:hypothetical protein